MSEQSLVEALIQQNAESLRQNAELMRALIARDAAPAPAVAPPPAAFPVAQTVYRVRDLARAYLRGKGVSKKSHGDDRTRAATILETVIGVDDQDQPIKFGDLETSAVNLSTFTTYREIRAKQKTKKYDELTTAATRNREVCLVTAWYTWGSKQADNGQPLPIPIRRLRGVPMEEEDNIREVKISSSEELFKVIDKCRPLVKAMILAFVSAGPRRMEICRLRWDQFDHKTGRYVLLRTKTKNKTARVIQFLPFALEAILALPEVSDYVFANPKTGRYFNDQWLYRMFRKDIDASGFRYVNSKGEEETLTFHSLRHSFAYIARREWKMPEKVIQAILGHKTRSTFDRYGIVDQAEVEECLQQRDEIFAELAERRGPRASRVEPEKKDKKVTA